MIVFGALSAIVTAGAGVDTEQYNDPTWYEKIGSISSIAACSIASLLSPSPAQFVFPNTNPNIDVDDQMRKYKRTRKELHQMLVQRLKQNIWA